MKTRRKDVDTQQVVVWLRGGRFLSDIARQVGMSRQGLWKRLKAEGLLLERWTSTTCWTCGQEIRRRKRQLRQGDRQFCSQECFHLTRRNPDMPFIEDRNGGYLARAIVRQLFDLKPEHVVHHKDKNQRNNDRSNLAVFASQSDHLRYHHGKPVRPLWDGAA